MDEDDRINDKEFENEAEEQKKSEKEMADRQ